MNERQLSCCEKAYSALCEAENAEKTGVTRDAIQVCIDSAIENLMVLTGEKSHRKRGKRDFFAILCRQVTEINYGIFCKRI